MNPIKEFIVETFKIASDDELKENFPHIADALDIDASEVDLSNRDSMINAIAESFEEDELNEDETKEDYRKILQSFFEGYDKKKKMKEQDDDDAEEDDDEDEMEEMKQKHKKMKKESAEEDDDDEDDDEDEMEEMKQKHNKMKKESAEDHFITSDQIDVNENVDALFADDETLTEEFKEKAKVIFEAAVVSKVNDKISQIVEEFNDMLEERVEEIEEDLQEKVSTFMDYTVQEWLKENSIAIESGIRTEVTESFMEGLKNLLDEHYVDIPEQKVDLVEELQSKIEELESGLNETLEENARLTSQLNESTREEIIDEISEDLSVMQQEKFESLMENISYEDESTFRKKCQIIKETHFSNNSSLTEETLTETVDDDIVIPDDEPSGEMSKYVKALSKLARS